MKMNLVGGFLDETIRTSAIMALNARGEQWNNVAGYNVDIDLLKTYNIKLTSFKEFVEKHKDQFKID